MQYHHVPTFRPSLKEWEEGLEKFTTKIEGLASVRASGLARVIPPKEWKWLETEAYERTSTTVTTKFKPIRQCTSTRAGVTRCQIQEMEACTMSEFREMVSKSHPPPAKLAKRIKENTYTQETLDTIERTFWKQSLSHTSKPCVYGADISASCFEKDVEACGKGWNFSALESVLSRGLGDEEKRNLLGVASSYLYIGSYGAMFSCTIFSSSLDIGARSAKTSLSFPRTHTYTHTKHHPLSHIHTHTHTYSLRLASLDSFNTHTQGIQRIMN